MMESLRKGELKGITDRLGNVLETVTIQEYPVIEEIKELLRSRGAENALMSGSGPTVFGIFRERDAAQEAAQEVEKKRLAKQGFVTTFYRESNC